MKTQTKTTHMETGSIPNSLHSWQFRQLWRMVINLLYNIVDRIYMGHIPGYRSRRADGCRTFYSDSDAAECIRHAVLAPAVLHVHAIAMGKKDNDLAEKVLGNCFTLLVGLAVVLTHRILRK